MTAVTAAARAATDPRPLTPAEQRSFLPLVCAHPLLGKTQNNCRGVLGTDAPVNGAATLSLDAIAYGGFSRAGADEAYITYAADFEPHASNFGGGLLFARDRGRWHRVRWYSGGQMDHCLALPGVGAARMLCLAGWSGQGEVDSSVWIDRVPPDNADNAFAKAATAVLKAQDDREAGFEQPAGNYQCGLRHAGEGVLLSIDELTRAPGVFAISHITYAAPRDADAACRGKSFADVRESKGTVRYVLKGGTVIAQPPVPFAKTDY